MKLSTRLIISHLLVVVCGAIVTFSVVAYYAPADFDRRFGAGPPPEFGRPTIREHFSGALNDALLLGISVGIILSTLLGVLLSRRLGNAFQTVSALANAMAQGDYRYRAAIPKDPELAALVSDIHALGESLAEVEATRMRLIGEVAHEMRTPLTIIDGNIEGMIDGVVLTSLEQLNLLQSEVRRLRRLSDDLRELSKTQDGNIVFHIKPVELEGIVQKIVERFDSQAEDAGITIRQTGVYGTGMVDTDRITQVLTNLIGNALQATPRGGEITITGESSNKEVKIHITDTGIGIAPDDLNRIFERFYRINAAGHTEGSGVGLTIARALMRGMHGELRATSKGIGQGATFTLELPAYRASARKNTS